MINYTPVFIHIASCGGRSLRKIFNKILDNNIYIHHINPGLWVKDIPRNKIIRLWLYRDVTKMNKNDKINKMGSTTKIIDLPLINNMPIKYFIILRNPVYRVLAERKHTNIDMMSFITNPAGYNMICKSILIAFTGNIDLYFEDIDNNKLEEIKSYIIDNNVMIGFTNQFNNTLKQLSDYLEYNKFLDFIDEKNTINSNKKYENNNQNIIDIIKKNNKYDILLYEWALDKY